MTRSAKKPAAKTSAPRKGKRPASRVLDNRSAAPAVPEPAAKSELDEIWNRIIRRYDKALAALAK